MAVSTLRRRQDTDEVVAEDDEDVRGRKALDTVGLTVGTVDDSMIDDAQNTVRFLRVECGGFLGLGATQVMIPVEAAASITGDAVTIDRGAEHPQGTPRYDPRLLRDQDERYWGDVSGCYGFAPFWGRGYTYPPYPRRWRVRGVHSRWRASGGTMHSTLRWR